MLLATVWLTIAASVTLAQPPRIAARPALAEPSLSPQGEIAFASGGDLWGVPLGGGEARLLVAHPATESRPLWSPDGKRLAFVSNRTGNGDVYVLELATGRLTRITYDDAAEQLDAWSRDGEWLYFSSSARDIAGMNDVYRVRSTGGTPAVVAGDRYASEYFSQPSPDGKSLAIDARANVNGQWWRHGHSHLDESELWLVTLGDVPQYRRIGEAGGAKDVWPQWSPDGATLYYMSDRSGQENLWSRPVAGGAAKQLTRFTNGRVLWPQIAADGKTIVFERDFGIWAYDVATGSARTVAITLRGAVAGRGTEPVTLTRGWESVRIAPDGKKVAFIARGEVFAAGTKDGGDALRITRSLSADGPVVWGRDSRSVFFIAQRDGASPIVRAPVLGGTETVIVPAGDNAHLTVSPDGKLVAYTRNGGELHVVGADGTNDRVLARGVFSRAPFAGGKAIAWSPDSRWIAYLNTGTRGFDNVWVVAAEGGEARQVSFLASSFANGLEWAPDGTWLLYQTSQRTEEAQLVRVDLVPRSPRYREDLFRDLFAAPDTTKPAPRRTEIVFDGLRNRATLLQPGLVVDAATISPDGKSLALVSSGSGQSNLYLWSLDETAREAPVARQLTTTAGPKSNVQWSPDGRELWYTDGGVLTALTVESRNARPVAMTAELEVDFHAEKLAVFEQAWRWEANNFFHPQMNGVDWPGVRERVAPYVAGAQTPDELRRILQLMVGELNASHMGVSGPAPVAPQPVGRLGLRFDRAALERGTYRVAELIPLGPAALAGGIAVGDQLRSIQGVALDGAMNIDSLLQNTAGRRVELGVAAANGAVRTVAVRPVSLAAEKNLVYRAWVEERRAYVAKVSNGRLGYVHMLDMGAPSLAQLYVDLDAENFGKDGVVIDVRNNNGGFVNPYALDVFTRKGYLTMVPRGEPAIPARSQLGQRSLEKPTVLVVNQHSLSDAEDFTEGYRALGLGPVVGEPTAGWIIFTSNVTLLDGQSSLRLPFSRILDHEGKDMELVPRKVDVPVTRPVGEHYSGKDTQLDAAVQALLQKIGR
jgi:Tol biopolymer transport system component/C-terminal processing protease CtpA/Prc